MSTQLTEAQKAQLRPLLAQGLLLTAQRWDVENQIEAILRREVGAFHDDVWSGVASGLPSPAAPPEAREVEIALELLEGAQ